MTSIDGAHFSELIAELEGSIEALIRPLERQPSLWLRARPGKWSVSQHCEHLALCLELMPPLFMEHARSLAQGALPPRPRRGLFESMFVALVIKRGMMPRGGPAISPTLPSSLPELPRTVARLRGATELYRHPALGLDAAALDRLWIRNPFVPRLSWHYSLPEAIRIQTVHVRHHAAQVLQTTRS